MTEKVAVLNGALTLSRSDKASQLLWARATKPNVGSL